MAKAPALNLFWTLQRRRLLVLGVARPCLGPPSAPSSCSSGSRPTGSGCCSRSMLAIGVTCAWIWRPWSGNWVRCWSRPASGSRAPEQLFQSPRCLRGGPVGAIPGPEQGLPGRTVGVGRRSEGNVVFAFGEIGHQGGRVPGGRLGGGRPEGRPLPPSAGLEANAWGLAWAVAPAGAPGAAPNDAAPAPARGWRRESVNSARFSFTPSGRVTVFIRRRPSSTRRWPTCTRFCRSWARLPQPTTFSWPGGSSGRNPSI